VSRRCHGGLSKDGDSGEVGGGADGRFVEEQSSIGLDGEACSTCSGHGLDGCESDDGNIESHILIWLGDLDDGEGVAKDGVRAIERAEERTCTFDGGICAFHGFDGDTGLGGDDDGLAKVEGGEATGDAETVRDIFVFVFGWGALGKDARFGKQRFQILGGRDQLDAFVGQDLGDRTEQHVGVACAQVEEELSETPVWAEAGEYLGVLDLAGHNGTSDLCGSEGVDKSGELSEREPVNLDVGVGCGARVDLRIGFFADGGDDDGDAFGASSVQQQEREASVTGDESEDGLRVAQFGGTPSPYFRKVFKT